MKRLTLHLLALVAFLSCFNASLFASPTVSSGTAALVGTDTTTQGNWQGMYGTVGYYIPNGPSEIPSDGSTFSPGAASIYTWGTNVSSASALETGTRTNIASCWYSNNLGTSAPSLTFDVVIPAGQTETVALYLLDYDKQGRSESVSVTDASNNPLSGPTAVSGTNFANGEYLLYTITGEVHINITLVGGVNAVASGIFWGENGLMPPPASAPYFTSFVANPVSAGAYAQVAKLTLPAGTYLIHASGSFDQLETPAHGIYAQCFLFHSSIDIGQPGDSGTFLGFESDVIIPAVGGSSNRAGGTAYSEVTTTLRATDTIIWACADSTSNVLGGASSVVGGGSLVAIPYQTINMQ